MSKLTGSTSTYKLDQAVIFTGQDVAILRAALEEILNENESAIFVPKYKYFDKEVGEYIKEAEVDEKKVKLGKHLKIVDPNETFKSTNIVVGYNANLITPLVKDAYLTIMHRMEMDARAGKTISIEEFKKTLDESKGSTPTGVDSANESN